MCVEPKQKYKYNCLQKWWKLSLLPKFWGTPKLGALGLSLFSLVVNPRLDATQNEMLRKILILLLAL